MTSRIEPLLRESVQRGASDLHITVGIPPMLRINGRLVAVEQPALSVGVCETLARELLSDEAWQSFTSEGEYDFSYSIAGLARFRINVFRQRGTISIALRTIPFHIPAIETLALPAITEEIIKLPKGLVLVTGPTGSGKSTTLAAMINRINETMERYILTLEDPIEYLHSHHKSIVVQREIGADTKTFASGLRAALREDPDVIVIGEMRDLETISTAITAAETGHLVFATLHTPDSSQTIDRLIDIFPSNQQGQIRYQLANVLSAIFSQKLMSNAAGNGRIAAVEVLVNTPAIANLIRSEKVHQIKNIIQTGTRYGMQTMEQTVTQLIKQGKVDPRDIDETVLFSGIDY